MPVTLLKKPKASKTTSPLVGAAFAEEASSLVTGLDLTNRTTRTPLGWITDGSPSMTGFMQLQLDNSARHPSRRAFTRSPPFKCRRCMWCDRRRSIRRSIS